MSKLILIGVLLWTLGVLLSVQHHSTSSYAKGFQVRTCDKQWGI